jgi:hypothetical protein
MNATPYNFSTNGSTWVGWTGNYAYDMGTEPEPKNTPLRAKVRDAL